MGAERVCPGCGLSMPRDDAAVYDGYFHTSPECWSVFTEVIGAEFSDAVLFGQAHQLTVDAYAVQHAGGPHPDKSVGIHLSGLHLVLDRGLKPPNAAPYLQRLAESVESWPHFPPPEGRGSLTVFDVAMADSTLDHAERARTWATQVWDAWSEHQDGVRTLVDTHLSF